MAFKTDKQRKAFFAQKGNTRSDVIPEIIFSVSSKKFPKEKFFISLKKARQESQNQIRKGASSSAISQKFSREVGIKFIKKTGEITRI